MRKILLLLGLIAFGLGQVNAQSDRNISHLKFKQLEEELPTPSLYRSASGAPGSAYYQQKADYEIIVELDDNKQSITGSEIITYTNNSPDPLEYLWIQLDQNIRDKDGLKAKTRTGKLPKNEGSWMMSRIFPSFPGGFKIHKAVDKKGKPLNTTVNYTMMRIDLEKPLKTGEQFEMQIEWSYNINDRIQVGGRSGFEYFEADENYLYTIAQFFPRMAVYNDIYGWQNKQFLGVGEFTLPFGDYKVSIEVPNNHIVASTGDLKNASKVLTKTQQNRLKEAKKSFAKPILIVTQEEAIAEEKIKTAGTKTWKFEAENVRDFAFASSRKFIWDAMATDISGKTVMSMSYYPKEGNPLWERYSTRAVAHTIKVYSKFTIDYPYSKAISVHSNRIGMEYPMICFIGGRPRADGSYSAGTKHGMIGLIIHEVGHNFFPMIINSDERQWAWMDEGLNTFVQYLTEQEWDRNYPSRRGPAEKIVDYMKGDKMRIVPIMTNSESIIQLGNNAYGKPATALNILRETVMGRELFDKAFKYYCERWEFKHPSPADFFRTMEDASAVDLDWFWRGWFYTVDNVDFELSDVRVFDSLGNEPLPLVPDAWLKVDSGDFRDIGSIRNDTAIPSTFIELDAVANDSISMDYAERKQKLRAKATPQKPIMQDNWQYVELDIKNVGGLLMPLVLRFHFESGAFKVVRIPVEVWIGNENGFTKAFRFKEGRVVAVEVDPYRELADCDRNNNYWPVKEEPTEFDNFVKEQEEKE